ncbi:ubiquinol-cytochrome-c reductase complex assembly factor 1 [Phymastichus coffea]|uniref:ubiquinol-cytochrome-c reductase complex assembly factor 1 n=1 Tax=Phymastichus coffea TaxID=108790 RepID=UPI00273AF769|nr:ubiquinol-cytochrome-c reductase complex assembly factor 1 [Phymastichus coffea]XP_058805524.1 ubiquinol-cytochrome-c reductase complex assembly factor 1 [Phymastichus coffea]
MVNLGMTTFLLSINRRLVLPSISFLTAQRYNYNMTSFYKVQQNEKADVIIMSKRNAMHWPNLLKKSKIMYKLRLVGSLLYENIADEINYNEFFQKFEMEDTFLSWFLITEVHIWMMALRIMQEEEHGLVLRNHLIEAMWNDVKIRSKKLGIINTKVMNQQLELLSQQFNASLVGYDDAIFSNDTLLANHIWTRFFNKKTTNPVQLEQLVKYIRKQVNLLSKTKTADIFSINPSVAWISL